MARKGTVSTDQSTWICDGVDDHLMIQAAINSLPTTGGKVELSAGTFSLRGAITMNKNNCTLMGQGVSTVLRWPDGANLNSMIDLAAEGITIRDFKFEGNSLAQTAGSERGIQSGVHGSHITMQRLWFHDFGGNPIIINSAVVVEDINTLDCAFTRPGAMSIRYSVNVHSGMMSRNYIDAETSEGTVGGTGGAGMIVFQGSSADSKNIIISNNFVKNGGDNGVEVRNFVSSANLIGQVIIEGNIFLGGTEGRGVDIGDAKRVVIKGNYISGRAGQGIHIRSRGVAIPDQIVIEGNIVDHCTDDNTHGISVESGTNVRVIGNEVSYSSRSGIWVGAPGTIVVGNTVYNNSQELAATFAGISIVAEDCHAANNHVYDDQATRTQRNGYRIDADRGTVIGGTVIGHTDEGVEVRDADDVLIQGLSCGQNGQRLAAGNRSGIKILANGANLNRTQIINCRFWDTQGTPTQTTGITLNAASGFTLDGTRISENNLSGVATPFATAGTGTVQNTVFRNNGGYATENSGTATINSGSTSVTVTHGLAVTPAAKDISWTFTENPTNDPGNSWVSNITATQFNINVRNNPGASNLDVAWRVGVL